MIRRAARAKIHRVTHSTVVSDDEADQYINTFLVIGAYYIISVFSIIIALSSAIFFATNTSLVDVIALPLHTQAGGGGTFQHDAQEERIYVRSGHVPLGNNEAWGLPHSHIANLRDEPIRPISASHIQPAKDPAIQWPRESVLNWLAANGFSDDWQNTFKSLNIEHAEFLELWKSPDGFGMMYQVVYPRLAKQCGQSGTGWDPSREREEGRRMRRLIREIVDTDDIESAQEVHRGSQLQDVSRQGFSSSTETSGLRHRFRHISTREDPNLTSKLVEAVESKDLGTTRKLLEYGGNTEVKNSLGATLLQIAVQDEFVEMMKLLLEHGADTKAKYNGGAPLHHAITARDPGLIHTLLYHGADLKAANASGDTPLHYAVKLDYPMVTRMLLERGADLEMKNNSGNTPLHCAVLLDRPVIIKMLLDHGADSKAMNASGDTPLHYVVRLDYPMVTGMLLERGADLEMKNNSGNTLLHCAIMLDRPAIIKMLLNRGADSKAMNASGDTPLHYAVRLNYPMVTGMLLERGADLEMKNNSGNTPLHCAIMLDSPAIIEMLLECGADLKVKNDSGETPLHYAVRLSYPMVTRMLLERGADLEMKNDSGNTPLHCAIMLNSPTVIEMLLECGADLKVKNDSGETPLHYAVRLNYPMVTGMLLEHGADLEMKNDSGETILQQALKYGTSEVRGVFAEYEASRLLANRANANTDEKHKDTPPNSVAERQYLESTEMLLVNGENANTENDEGAIPMTLASAGIMREMLASRYSTDSDASDSIFSNLYTEGQQDESQENQGRFEDPSPTPEIRVSSREESPFTFCTLTVPLQDHEKSEEKPEHPRPVRRLPTSFRKLRKRVFSLNK